MACPCMCLYRIDGGNTCVVVIVDKVLEYLLRGFHPCFKFSLYGSVLFCSGIAMSTSAEYSPCAFNVFGEGFFEELVVNPQLRLLV